MDGPEQKCFRPVCPPGEELWQMSISGTMMMVVMMVMITTMVTIIVDLTMMATIVLLESPVEKSYDNDQNRVQGVGAFEIC